MSTWKERAQEGNSVLLDEHFLTDKRIIKKLIEGGENLEVLLFSGDNVVIDCSAPKEQQHDFFSTAASLINEPTEGIKSIEETGKPSEATILAIRQARFFEGREAPIAIVDQKTEKGQQKAWYCLTQMHNLKPGDHVSVTPVTEHYYSGGRCETYRLSPR